MFFDNISNALLSVKDNNEEKRRRSKRISKFPQYGNSHEDLIRIGNDHGSDASFGVDKSLPVPKHDTPVSSSDDEDDIHGDRERWKDGDLVLLHMIGYAVGLSNVWRFPFLCYQHGGGAFLIPYFFFLLTFAYPFVYLELLIGQFTQTGAIACWKLVPLFRGVGVSITIINYLFCINTNTVLAWCLFYLFQTIFQHPLPWISCDNGFAKTPSGRHDSNMQRWKYVNPDSDIAQHRNWHTENCSDYYSDMGTSHRLTSTQRLPGSEYFKGRVQRMWKSGFADSDTFNDSVNSDDKNGILMYGLDEDLGIGPLNTDTCIALIVAFLFVLIFALKGFSNSAKLIVTAVISPYVILGMLFYRATGLNGAWIGLGNLFYPDLSKLGTGQAWWIAAEQVLISTGAGLGVHLTFASHNKPNRDIIRDATLTIVINSFTSLLAASVIYMFLGHLHVAVGRSLENFHIAGPELSFAVMADVLGALPESNFYAFCFYFMLLVLGLATSACSLMCAKISMMEVLPFAIKFRAGSRLMLIVFLALISFITSALNLTRGGLHLFNFYDKFVGSFSLICCAILFLIGSAWVWGLNEIVHAAEVMGIPKPSVYFQICWKFIGIAILIVIFCGSVLDPESYKVIFSRQNPVSLSPLLQGFGYAFSWAPLLSIPLGAFYALSKTTGKGCTQIWLLAISPKKDHKDILATGTGKRTSLAHYMYLFVTESNATKANKVAPAPEIAAEPEKIPELDDTAPQLNAAKVSQGNILSITVPF